MSEEGQEKVCVGEENAAKFWEWLQTRGGLLRWQSISLSDPGASATTPALTEDGKPYPKPHWKYGNEPSRLITDPAEVLVTVDKEVKRLYVAVRPGGNGMSLKVSDGGSRKIRSTLARLAEKHTLAVAGQKIGPYYVFDYMTQEAVFMATEKAVPLAEWIASQPAPEAAGG